MINIKVCAFKIGGIGDALMTTPFLRALKKGLNDVEIVYVTSTWAEPVLKHNKNIDKLITFDSKIIFNKDFTALLRLIKNLRKEKFDICFILDKSFWINLLCFFIGKKKIGFNRGRSGLLNDHSVEYKSIKHEIYYYLDLLKFIGVVSDGTDMDLVIDKKSETWAKFFVKRIKKPIIGLGPGGAVNPGEAAFFRRWEKNGYVELVNMILDQRWSVILIGGPCDRDCLDAIRKTIKNDVLVSTHNDLIKNAAIIKHCDVFVTHDSGLMHIAAAVKTPVLSIFGPTNPKKKAPIGKIHKYVWARHLYSKGYEFYGKHPKNVDEITISDIKPKRIFNLLEHLVK